MEAPRKPELQHREKKGQYGEIVVELTPESEQAWADYLREAHFAKIALRRNNERTTEITNAEGASS